MRIHVQNPAGEELFPVTPRQWQEALARNPGQPDFDISFADDDAGFDAAIGQAEVLLTWTKVVRARFPAGALPGIAQ